MNNSSRVSKNIWVFNQYASAPKYSTGAGERHFYIAKNIKNKLLTFTIFSSSFNHLFVEQPKVTKKFTEEIIDNITFCWVKTLQYGRSSTSMLRIISLFQFMFKLFFIPKDRFGKPDMIIISSMSMFPIYSALWYKMRFPNLKIIFEIRDLWPLTLIKLAKHHKWHPFVILLSITEKIAYNKSDYIISLLPNANKYIQTVINNKFNYQWIPNGSIINENKSIINYKMPNGFIVGYCGTLTTAMSIEIFIDVVKDLSHNYPIYGFILGDGPIKKELLKRANNNKNLIFHKKVKKDYVNSYMSQCDLFYIGWRNVDLYQYGVSANKYSDYMLAGKPIISSGEIFNDPVKISGSGKSIKSEDFDALKNTILEFYHMNENDRKQIGRKGKEYFNKYLNIDIISNKYEELIKHLLI